MRDVRTKADFSQMRTENSVVLYVFVNWSVYAKMGLLIVEEVENHFRASLGLSGISFWRADVSDSESPAFFIDDWLKQQQRADLQLFPAIGMGNGAIVWINKGSVIDFASKASHLKRSGIIEKTTSHFNTGSPGSVGN